MIFVGVAAVMWAIWCTRNDLIFQNKQFHSFIQAIFRGAYWLRFGPYCSVRTQGRSFIRRAKH
jgi:hypothetical protein